MLRFIAADGSAAMVWVEATGSAHRLDGRWYVVHYKVGALEGAERFRSLGAANAEAARMRKAWERKSRCQACAAC